METEPTIQQPQENVLSPTEEKIERKKRRFYRRIRLLKFVLLIGLILMILSYASLYVYTKNKKTYNITATDPEPVKVVEETPPVVEQANEYYNNTHRFYVRFPLADTYEAMETSSEENLLIKIFSADITPAENVTEFNITKGYIIRVNALKISARSIDELILVKRENYMANCPPTAQITDVASAQINGFATKQFAIENCNSNLIVSYLSLNDYIYEIIQIYKGDIGFEQVYKLDTIKITDTMNFIFVGEKLLQSPFVKFEDVQSGFSFEYPIELDTVCCAVAPPPYGKPEKIIVLAEQSNDKALGLFIDKNLEALSLEEYVAKQKTLLVDDYTVVKGFAPQGTQQDFETHNLKGILLQDFSWKENDLIFVRLVKENRILILSKTEIGNTSLDPILKSLKIF